MGTTTAAQMTHRCAAVGCQQAVPLRWLMCIDHWRMVPAVKRREVWACYRRLGTRPADENAERYRAAVQAAVDAVHEKAHARKARADTQTPPLF